MKLSKRTRLSIIPLLLFSFFFVQSSYIPTSLAATIPANASLPEPPDGPSVILSPPKADEGSREILRHPAKDSGTPQDDQVVALSDIENQLGLQIQESGDVYIFTDPNDGDFLQIVEKLPEGGLGRLLRYRGWQENGESVDVEFVYEDHANQVTILDYASGRFYRTTFTEKRADPLSVYPQRQDKNLTPEFSATQSASPKFLFGKLGFVGAAEPRVNWLHSQFEALSSQDVWTNRHVRGPPLGGLTL